MMRKLIEAGALAVAVGIGAAGMHFIPKVSMKVSGTKKASKAKKETAKDK